MEEFLTREEIRRMANAVVGDSTNQLVNSQQIDQMNAWIDLGAQKVAACCRWIALKRRALVWVDQDQALIPFSDIELAYWLGEKYQQYRPGTYGLPQDPWQPPQQELEQLARAWIGPGNIIEIGIYRPGSERPLAVDLGIIQVHHDQTRLAQLPGEVQLNDQFTGQTAAQTQTDVNGAVGIKNRDRGMPRVMEARKNGLAVYPIPDQRYVVLVRYAISASWSYYEGTRGGKLTPNYVDQIPSRVDSVAIVNFVVHKMYLQQGDMASAEAYMKDNPAAAGQSGTGEFWSRIAALKGWQNTGQVISVDSSCTFDDDNRGRRGRGIPQWDNRAETNGQSGNSGFSGNSPDQNNGFGG